MNTYITNSLKRIKTILASNEQPSFESIDSTIGELEMMKMEIEQHITNMPPKEEYKNIRCSAECTIEKLSKILGYDSVIRRSINTDKYSDIMRW